MACKTFYLMVILGILQGCGLFQNTEKSKSKSSTIEDTQLAQVKESTNALNSWNNDLSFQMDSANRMYSIHIRPTGPFHFSAEKGFEGTAEELWMDVNDHSVQKRLDAKEQGESLSGTTKESLVQQQHSDVDQSSLNVEKSPSWKWMLLLVAAAGILYFMVFGWKAAIR